MKESVIITWYQSDIPGKYCPLLFNALELKQTKATFTADEYCSLLFNALELKKLKPFTADEYCVSNFLVSSKSMFL